MNRLSKISNINSNIILEEEFDLAIFASGYEERSSHLARIIDKQNIRDHIILGFSELRDQGSRKANDEFYFKKFSEPLILKSDEEIELFLRLKEKCIYYEKKSHLKVLLDYTSMSRLWYSGILNFFKMQYGKDVTLYLNYSIGEYNEDTSSNFEYSYSSINSLPSLEGSLSSNNRILLVLSIGFAPYLVKSVIEEIEPNDIIGILPIPSINESYEKKSLDIMENDLKNEIIHWVKCSVYNLENIFRTYAEIASNNLNEKDVLFLSLGPKIFSIASILVSQRFEHVTCLYLKSHQNGLTDVKSIGKRVCNTVEYREIDG